MNADKQESADNQDYQGESFSPDFVSRDCLEQYMGNLKKCVLLGADEQMQLARRYQEYGDEEAARKLVYSNLRLVVRIVKGLKGKWGESRLDLIQEGNLGLLRAIRKYDPDRGIKFSYYASFWIRAYILKYIMDNWRIVRIGATHAQRSLFYNLGKEKRRLEALEIRADPETISRQLGVSSKDVEEMAQIMDQHDLSLDSSYSEESEFPHIEKLADDCPAIEEILMHKEWLIILRQNIMEMMPALNSREKDIINLRLLSDCPRTLNKIGEKFAISRERVRQIESRLLEKIRDRLEQSTARSYFWN